MWLLVKIDKQTDVILPNLIYHNYNVYPKITSWPTKKQQSFKLILVGSCRGLDDEQRVDELKQMVAEMGLQASVEFKLNVSFYELKKILQQTSVGLHTMWNEHFGIGLLISFCFFF